MRPTTLVLAASSPEIALARVAVQVASAANVSAVVYEGPEPFEGSGLRKAWREIERIHTTYALTDADPFEDLRRACVEAWKERPLERFELAALEPPPPLPRPDFYLVVDAGDAADLNTEQALRREWYFGVLARAAPSRVLAAKTGSPPDHAAAEIKRLLASLPAGPEIPAAATLIELARKHVPGQRDAL